MRASPIIPLDNMMHVGRPALPDRQPVSYLEIHALPRVLPAGLGAELDATLWPLPPVFRWLQQNGDIAPAELARTFNCGIGMIAVTSPEAAETAIRSLEAEGETVHRIGRIIRRAEGAAGCVVANLGASWPG